MIADPDYVIKFIPEQCAIDYRVVSDAKERKGGEISS